ncbi:hypothetical protein ACFV8T_00460 [Streptomyces sp. NPDC059832]|uniref:hypothetical protein n=1 Tax=Streptomyces sp. NPDC059832 TaxID=3346966 RepID=UPI0036573B4C
MALKIGGLTSGGYPGFSARADGRGPANPDIGVALLVAAEVMTLLLYVLTGSGQNGGPPAR